MKSRITIVSSLLAIAVLVWWFSSQIIKTSPIKIATETSMSSMANVTKAAAANGSQPFSSSNRTEPATNNAPLASETIRKFMESQNVPIEFYGKIVDQDGNPLVEAKVQGEVLHLKIVTPIPGGGEDEIIPINQKTDADGRFEVKGVSGRTFQIESVQKDGYEVEHDNCPHVFDASHGSFENPIIFKMWSTNIHEQLLTGDTKFPIIPDGRPYFLNLTDGTISETSGGDLKIWVKRPESVASGQRYDWSCEMDTVNGGLQPSDKYSMFLAPEDGYDQQSFKFNQTIGGGWGDTTGKKQFYIMIRGGKIFGRISIEIFAYYNNRTPVLFAFPTPSIPPARASCGKARCYAIGAQADVGGVFISNGQTSQVESSNVRPPDHRQRALYWNTVLTKMQLKEE